MVMYMYRNTYVEINLNNLKNNVSLLIDKYNNYDYYFAVIKADSYGHNGTDTIKAIINGGCNYLAVATLDEAIEVRKTFKDIPILCLGIIDKKYIKECIKNNITITISSLDYLKNLKLNNNLKVHIKINTGMNRLGISTKEEFTMAYNYCKENNIILEGIYTHMYEPNDITIIDDQMKKFEEITSDIELKDIPIIHVSASEATENMIKKDYINGCRLGIAMYGLVDYKNINFMPTFKVISEVIQINEVSNETIGYNGIYKAKNKEKIAVVSIGYADGIIRKNTGRYVYINNKKYQIVGNICMDMLFVKVDNSVKVNDKVEIIKDINHIKEIAKYLDTIPYEVICSISKRVPRIYK